MTPHERQRSEARWPFVVGLIVPAVSCVWYLSAENMRLSTGQEKINAAQDQNIADIKLDVRELREDMITCFQEKK